MNETAKEIIDSIKIIVDSEIKKGTNIYSGIVDVLNSDGTCIVKMSGKQYKVGYIGGAPTVGSNQKIFVPQNNMAQAFIINPIQTGGGGSGAVDSVNGKTGNAVLSKNDIGLSNVDNIKQYSTDNPPPYPVTSVNGKTGDVVISEGSPYVLPVATETTLGGVMPLSKTTEMTQDVGIDENGRLYTAAGGGGDDSTIFICNVTGAGTATDPYVSDKTTQEIYDASRAGKIVYVKDLIFSYTLSASQPPLARFDNVSGSSDRYLIILSNGTIYKGTLPFELTTDKVTSLSSSSTDKQYPSAKCVYNLIGDVQTVINNINAIVGE